MRCMAILAALVGCQGIDLFRAILPHDIDRESRFIALPLSGQVTTTVKNRLDKGE